jgi:hypothetical protein
MKLHKRASVIALFLAVVLAGGVAAAAWLVSGTGAASARATSAVSLTVTGGTPSASLYPGASAAVVANVTNPNPFPVRLTGATFGAVTVTPLAGKTCTAASVTVSGPVTLASSVNLAANSGATPVTISNALTMVPTAENGCQGATYSVQVTLNGESA